jgi:hypothetical protein
MLQTRIFTDDLAITHSIISVDERKSAFLLLVNWRLFQPVIAMIVTLCQIGNDASDSRV